MIETLEPRLLLSVTLDSGDRTFHFTDASGDAVTVKLSGPGSAQITLHGDAADGADIDAIQLVGVNHKTRLQFTVKPPVRGIEPTLQLGDIIADGPLHTLEVKGADVIGGTIIINGELRTLRLRGDVADLQLSAHSIRGASIQGELTDGSILATEGDLRTLKIDGNVHSSTILAGAALDASFDLATGLYQPATIRSAMIHGSMLDAILAAGGDPGADGLFADGEVLDGGVIKSLKIKGNVVGTAASPHPNPGIYTGEIGKLHVTGVNFTNKAQAAAATMGTGVIDPLPPLDSALNVDDIEAIIERAVARAQQLGVAATIALTDREGNLLAVVRMAGAAETVDIEAGGMGGLEAVDGIVATSLIAGTKAGTAALLSTSRGNAFTTRTAGYIIQQHFPPGIGQQPGGPLFGVQLSQLPTSDVNRLPLGLSADPGGLPLYRNGHLLGGIGVEVDGVYTVDPSRVGGSATVEEQIALAGQATLEPPRNIRADRIFVAGLRLDYANANPPRVSSLGALPDYDTLVGAADLVELLAPRISPVSKFAVRLLETPNGTIVGEVPDNAMLDFYDNGTGDFQFLAGDINDGQQLTTDDVANILANAHALNQRLRAAIRRDNPKTSQVSVSVVDLNGNVLGVFRTGDAPMFGYDVSVQKARTAAFFSRPDAAQQLRDLDGEVDVAAIEGVLPELWAVANPYGEHVDAANAIGVALDGSVAVADRSGGFLSRPNLPDGINDAPPGPFSAQGGDDRFSPFNTGLQTDLIIPQLVEFLLAFNGMDEAAALAAFADGTFGGGGVVPLDSNPGGGLPLNSLANGMQIFAGSVPLYKNGVLVGAVGVSGDGIEQDDMVAFAGAGGFLDPADPYYFQEFGPGVKRADELVLTNGIRLPYVKFPRAPFEGT